MESNNTDPKDKNLDNPAKVEVAKSSSQSDRQEMNPKNQLPSDPDNQNEIKEPEQQKEPEPVAPYPVDANYDSKLQNVLKIEFINRVTHIIQFNELTKDNIKKIINKNIIKIKKRFKEQDITISIDKNFINKIVELSNYNLSGARNIKNLLENKIDNLVIDNIIKNNKKIKIS